MKKLYFCNAHITDDLTLVSYKTPVVKFEWCGDWLVCSIYRASMTTMEHIRKFAKWLAESDNDNCYATLLEVTYKNSVASKQPRYTESLNIETGELVF